MNALTHTAADPSGGIRFNYALLDPAIAAAVQDTAQRIRAVVARSFVEIGQDLMQVKDALPHGRFTTWAQAELGMTQRTAENYMQAARFLDGKPETISHLPQGILYKLAAPTAPTDLVDKVVAAAASGDPLPAATVKRELDEAHNRALHLELERKAARNPSLTREQLAERKRRRDARLDKEELKRRAVEEAHMGRLRPLAERIATLGAAAVAALSEVYHNWTAQSVLRRLLDEMVSGSAQSAAPAREPMQ